MCRLALLRPHPGTGPATFGVEDMLAVISSKEANATAGERPLNNDETIYSCVMSAQLGSLSCVGRGGTVGA